MRWWWIAQAIFAETKIYMPCKSEISLVIKVYEYILLRNKMAQIFPRKFTHRNTKNNIRSANIQFSAAIVGSDAYMYICASWARILCTRESAVICRVRFVLRCGDVLSYIYIYIYIVALADAPRRWQYTHYRDDAANAKRLGRRCGPIHNIFRRSAYCVLYARICIIYIL